ncbi:MAG: universal stress protein [Gammaproteobacteria bacterium]|nr:universal stress protein [Gammaproteobacteria bacterium]
MLRKILVPVNFTSASARAVAVARDYCPEGATIRLLYVLNPSELAEKTANPAINPMHAKEERSKAESDATERLKRWAREDEEIAVEVGNAADEISEHADTWGADLIAMGTRSRGSLSQFLHGSATEWLVRHAKQPVLVVHDVDLNPDQAEHMPPLDH